MKQKIVSIVIALFMVAAPASYAADKVKVEWFEPDNYTDVRSANGGKEKFRKSVFAQLEKHFEKKAAKSLPEGMVLNIKVTNLNLAGDVRYNFGFNQEMRVVKSIYWPEIEFEYQLVDQGQVVKADSAKLRDMAFLDRLQRASNSHSTFSYEKALINEWFKDTVVPLSQQVEQQKTAVMSI